MKINKKQKKWLYVLTAVGIILLLAYSAYKPANIIGIPFMSQAFAVIGPSQTAYTGDTFQYTFNMTLSTEALPVSTPTRVVHLYKAYRMTDPAGNIVTTGCNTPDGSCNYVEEITTQQQTTAIIPLSLVFTITASTPSSFAGNPYGVVAMLFADEQLWDRNTNIWTDTPFIIKSVNNPNCPGAATQSGCNSLYPSCKWDGTKCITTLGVKFDVKTQTPPPTPTVSTIMTWFTNLFASIWSLVKSLFGWI